MSGKVAIVAGLEMLKRKRSFITSKWGKS